MAVAVPQEETSLKVIISLFSDKRGLGISIDGGTAQTHDYIRQVPGMFDRAFRAVDAANRKRLAIGAIFLKRCLNPLQTDIWTNKDNSFYRTESC